MQNALEGNGDGIHQHLRHAKAPLTASLLERAQAEARREPRGLDGPVGRGGGGGSGQTTAPSPTPSVERAIRPQAAP